MDEKRCNYFYYVIDTEQVGKRFAYAARVNGNNNLLAYIKRWRNCVGITPCKTYQYAKDLALYWNECYKQNRTYLYNDEPVYQRGETNEQKKDI